MALVSACSDDPDTQGGDSVAADSTGDTSTGDTSTGDTSTGDTSTGDTSTGDTSTADSGTADSGTTDTGTADTSTADTSTADTGTDTVVETAEHCDWTACSTCKAQFCNVVDNPCNDDPTDACEPAQQGWLGCVCWVADDGAASAACDTRFGTVGSNLAQPIIDCVRTNCQMCGVVAEDSGPAAPCQVRNHYCRLCAQNECTETVSACLADTACAAAFIGSNMCMCSAQQGTGTIEGCLASATRSGGALFSAAWSCVSTQCESECLGPK